MIVVRIWEGLGNQMFQYAYARALKEKGLDVRLDMGKAYDDIFCKFLSDDVRVNGIHNFKLSVPVIDLKEYGKYSYLQRDTEWKKIIFWMSEHSLWKYKFYEEEDPSYSEKMERVKGNCYIKGWFQSEQYFREIREILIREFAPRQKIKIPGRIQERLNCDESVSIHVRRGDYVKLGNALSPIYYQRAVQQISSICRSPVYFIFSDDLEWVKRNIKIDGNVIYVNENRELKDYEELFLMSRCKNNIIANSTFSWWAAWLNRNVNKRVIAPKRWVPGKGICFPKGWLTV